MFKNLIFIFTVFFISGCATPKDKIDTIVNYEVKKEYVLPTLTECQNLPKIKGNSFGELYASYIHLKNLYKECDQFNKNKNEWIDRNF